MVQAAGTCTLAGDLLPGCLISLIKRKLNIQTPYRISLSIITAKTPFLNSLLISLHHKSVKGVSYIKTDISVGGDCLINISTKVR